MNIDSNILLVANRNINLLNDAHLDDWYFLEYHRLDGVNQVSRHFTASSHYYMFACCQKINKCLFWFLIRINFFSSTYYDKGNNLKNHEINCISIFCVFYIMFSYYLRDAHASRLGLNGCLEWLMNQLYLLIIGHFKNGILYFFAIYIPINRI